MKIFRKKRKQKRKQTSIEDRLNIIMKSSMNIYNKNIFYNIYLKYYYKKYDWYKKLLNIELILIEEKIISNSLKILIYKINSSKKIYLLLEGINDIGYLYSINNHIKELFLNSNYIGNNYSKYLLKDFIEEKKNQGYKHIIFFTTNLTKSYEILKNRSELNIIKSKKFLHINQMTIQCDITDFYNYIKN